MKNPEFKRNLWLSFTRHRLIAMPVLLGLVFLALAFDSNDRAIAVAGHIYTAALTLFVFIVWLWGARNANQSIVDELHDKTWDQQRMSALGPWDMTWGKLLGSTAYNWYGGAICLLVAIPAAVISENPDWLLDIGVLIAGALLLHGGLIALNTYSSQYEARLIQRGGLGWIAIIFTIVFLQAGISQFIYGQIFMWWGLEFPIRIFMLLSVLLFGSCAVFAAWRVLSNALQVRTVPWAWPLFALILTGYASGFANPVPAEPVWYVCIVGLVVSMAMSYATLFTEPMQLPGWNRLRIRLERGDWRGLLQNLPLWPTTLLLAICFALAASMPALQPAGVRFSDSVVFGMPLTFALMAIRDAAIVMFFSFSPKARRAPAVALLYLFVLDGLLPFLFGKAGLHPVAFLFLPFGDDYGTAAPALTMGTHAAIAIGLVVWRLKRVHQKAVA